MEKGTAQLTDDEIAVIEERCSSATGGPWTSFIEDRDHFSGSSFIETTGEDIELSGASEADYDFIAAARTDVPRLLEEVQRLRKALAEREGSSL